MNIKRYKDFDIDISIGIKSKENYDFIKLYFTDIPISFEKYLEKSYIYVIEAKVNDKLVGCSIFNIFNSIPIIC